MLRHRRQTRGSSIAYASRRVTRSRLFIALAPLSVVALLVALVPVTHAAGQVPISCSTPDQVVLELDGWTRIAAPEFPTLPQTLTTYAVDPIAPERLFATNGTSFARSDDGGCIWTGVPLPSGPGLGTLTIHSIVVSAAAHDTVFVIVKEELPGTTVRTRVLRSVDSGHTFSESGGLMPGAPLKLTVSESDPNVAYLATVAASGTAAASTLLFSTHDSGVSFRLVPREGLQEGGQLAPEFADITLDPLVVDELWGAARNGLWRSVDGGASWTHLTQLDGSLRVVDVFRATGGAARVWAIGSRASYRSDDGGHNWRELPAVPAVNSVAHGAGPDQVLAVVAQTSGGWALGFDPAGSRWEVLKHSSVPMHGAQVDRGPLPTFYVGTDDRIWRSPHFAAGGGLTPPPIGPSGPIGSPPEPPPPPPNPIQQSSCTFRGAVNPGSPTKLEPPLVSPARVALTLEVGESVTVPYELTLPPGGTPVDLYFLVDASGSMEPALCGAANGATEIANTLVSAGIDAWFGVGSYQDFPGGEPWDCYAYRRDRNIAPLGQSFVTALQRIKTCGGTEPQAESLYQSATGEGNLTFVARGQDAIYRQGSLPVVIHIADESLNRIPPPAHTIDEAITALKAEGILQVGIAPNEVAIPWLSQVATETGSLAIEPVDCDGDGRPELAKGAPLVCSVPESGDNFGIPMAKAISGMVLAIRDDAKVELVVRDGGKVVAGIDPQSYPAVNLKRSNELAFGVTYRCGADQAGQTVPVVLGAQVREQGVAEAAALISCGTPRPLAIEVDKTNDADGDGTYTASEVAPAEGADVPFRAEVTNTGKAPLTIRNMIDEFSGTRLDICPDLVGKSIAPDATVRCDFELENYAPAADVLLENTITVTAAELGLLDRVAIGVGSSTVTTPRVPPEELPNDDGGGFGPIETVFPPINIPAVTPELPPVPDAPPAGVQSLSPQAQPQANPQTNPQSNPQSNPQANPQTNPQSQQQSNPQAQTQLQAQAGLAAQRQTQPQAAFAAAYDAISGRPDYGYAMTERRDPLAQARTTTALGAGGLLLAYGCLSLASRRVQVAKAGSQTSNRRASPRGGQ